MATRGDLEALTAGLEELLARVTAMIERDGPGTTSDDEVELVVIERGLASTLRRLRRLSSKLRD
jgi:N-methylhydantoinase B/oxoprolinase/acetone carboxylase alpha subunit